MQWLPFLVALAWVSCSCSSLEASFPVSSLGVSEYLRNPCMIVDLRVVENDIHDHEEHLLRERDLVFTKIALADRLLTTLHDMVDNECNTDFSLSTLPAIPNPFSHQVRDGYQMMERDLLFLTAHVYFTINETFEASPRCNHETLEFTKHLRGLTGRLENLMCSLRKLSNSVFHESSVLEEVLSLRLSRVPSCGGRSVWSCILINRVSQSLSLLRQFLEVGGSVSVDNDLAVLPPQKKSVPAIGGNPVESSTSGPDSQLSPLNVALPMARELRSHERHPNHRKRHRDPVGSFVSCMNHRFSTFAMKRRSSARSLFHHHDDLRSFETFLASLRHCFDDRRPTHDDWWDASAENAPLDRRALQDSREEEF